MAKHQFTSCITPHCNTPGTFDNLPACHCLRPLDSVPSIEKSSYDKLLSIMANELKKYTPHKLNTYNVSNQNAKTIVHNSDEYSCKLHYRTSKAKVYVIY